MAIKFVNIHSNLRISIRFYLRVGRKGSSKFQEFSITKTLMMNIKLTLEPNDHGKHIYHPGHVIKGTAILTLLRTKKFRGKLNIQKDYFLIYLLCLFTGIYIKVYGRARTYWVRQGKF